MSAVGINTTGSDDYVKRAIAPMEWTERHDILLCREILLIEPYRFKKGSVDKGKAWSTIAETLNCYQELKCKVTQRSVRERFTLIQMKYKTKNNKDERSSGTSAQTTELDELIEEISEKERAAEENRGSDENMRKLETDRAKAEEARKKAMERMSQTSKRLSDEGEDSRNKKQRRSGNDTIEFLRERGQAERALKEKELELKKIQIEEQAKAAQASQSQMTEMMQLMQQQQQQMQAMQTMLLQQQQQQGQALLALIESMKGKK